MSLTKITTEHAEILIRPEGIVQVNSKDHLFTVKDIKALQTAISDLTGNQKALILLVPSEFTTMDTDAKNFLSTPESGTHSIAKAYIIKSLAQRLLINFIVKVKGTPVPVRFFNEIDHAIEWLNSFQANTVTT